MNRLRIKTLQSLGPSWRVGLRMGDECGKGRKERGFALLCATRLAAVKVGLSSI